MTAMRRRAIPLLVVSTLLAVPLVAQGPRPHAVASSATTVGPPRGTVIVVGGGAMGPEIYSQFIGASGGPDALIVDVPNAGGADACAHGGRDAAGVRLFRNAGAHDVRVLCTTDRTVANSDSVADMLAHAGGVWFEGGRQFRLVDAYAGTKAEQGFHDVLARGGVVGGSSAGASILGDFLVRGAPSNDNRIMDDPAYEKGFAFLRGVAIDQHVVARERLPDLADSIISRRPKLLGISEDEGTAWVVRGDTATIIGRNKAFVYGGHDANDPGKPFLTLHPGDRYDLALRHVVHRAIEDSPLSATLVRDLVARYAPGGADSVTVLAAQNGEVFVDASFGIPPQPRFMPATTLPQFPLGQMSGVFTALCAQLPAPKPLPASVADSSARAGSSRTASATSRFQECMTRQVDVPIGMHRTIASANGEVQSDVDELYRFELGLEDPRTWPQADKARGWTAERHAAETRLTAYAADNGRRGAFVRIPDKRAVVIVLTSDASADARSIANGIADHLNR